MNRKLIAPSALVFFALVCRFVFSGMDYIAYALLFAAAVTAVMLFCKKSWIKRAVCAITAAGLVYLVIVEIPIIGQSSGDGDAEYDYIIVLGAAVHGDTPSLSLIERMSAARDYMRSHPDCTAIVSGGQGSNENLSEAQAMFDWLTANGIAPERIIKEDKATSTLENLKFSFAIISSRGGGSAAVVTSEYHIYRAKLLAGSLGENVGAVAAHTTYLPIRLNYFLREAFGVTYQRLLG